MKFLAFNIVVGAALAFVVVNGMDEKSGDTGKRELAMRAPAQPQILTQARAAVPAPQPAPQLVEQPAFHPVPQPAQVAAAPAMTNPVAAPNVQPVVQPIAQPVARPAPRQLVQPQPAFVAPPARPVPAAKVPARAPVRAVVQAELPPMHRSSETMVASAAPTGPAVTPKMDPPVLAEGETLMTSRERRRELYRLVESMELMYLRRVGKCS